MLWPAIKSSPESPGIPMSFGDGGVVGSFLSGVIDSLGWVVGSLGGGVVGSLGGIDSVELITGWLVVVSGSCVGVSSSSTPIA